MTDGNDGILDMLRQMQVSGHVEEPLSHTFDVTELTRDERIVNFNRAVQTVNAHQNTHAITCDFTAKFKSRPVLLNSLTPIAISDLRVGKSHRGRVLLARIVTQPMIMKAVTVLIEDCNDSSELVPLSIYGLTNTPGIKELKEGRHVAVKEPFFKVRADGSTGIRVDDLTGVVYDVKPSTITAGTQEASLRVEERLCELVLADEAMGSKRLCKALTDEGYIISGHQVRALRSSLRDTNRTDAPTTKLVPILSERRPEKHRVLTSPQVLVEREAGNEAFKAANFEVAERHYSAALSCCGDDAVDPNCVDSVSLWQLYGNRAASRLRQGRLVEALRDSLVSNSCAPADVVKPVLRCGEALAALGMFKECDELLEAAKSTFRVDTATITSKQQTLAPKSTFLVGPNKEFIQFQRHFASHHLMQRSLLSQVYIVSDCT
mmetsp:Transcript_2328/g.3645  ORF Transcript_2328/g.3645 Transcript_2328/m.3645 type:complete len:434 (-) Transcript_2328:828-2129(-)